MISIEFTTKSGSIYIADVVHKKIRRIKAENVNRITTEWKDYENLTGGSVGERLSIYWGTGKDDFSDASLFIGDPEAPDEARQRVTQTSEIVSLRYVS